VNLIKYNTPISNAKSLQNQGHYAEAFSELNGLEIKEKDMEFYNQLAVLSTVDSELNNYEVFSKAEKVDLAFDSLICAAGRCYINEDNADVYGCLGQLETLKRTVSNEYIFNAYDIIEKMSNKIVDKVIIVDDRIEFGKIAKENYINVDIISEELMKVPDLDKFMKSINKRKKGSTYLVTMISDYLYPFDKEFEVGTINYFSKLSITKLLNKYEFNHIEVYNSTTPSRSLL